MLFNTSRLSSRADPEGNIHLLAQQDRSLWNKEMIERGLGHLNQSASGTDISQFHLEAGIASCHCAAPSYEATDWNRILALYDMLVDLNPSPVIALNRAVAVANVNGPAAGLAAVDAIEPRDLLDAYYLFHAIQGQFHLELGNVDEAARNFRRACQLTSSKSEQALLQKKLDRCAARTVS